MDAKEHLLQTANTLFRSYGIRSVTMDDVAKEAGMSKKTIYIHFEDKNELVAQLMDFVLQNQRLEIEKHMDLAKNAVEEILQMINCMQRMGANFNPILFYDLQKYHPKVWLQFKAFKDEYVFPKVKANLLKGIAEGLYRKELQIDIIAQMRIEQVGIALSPVFFPPEKYKAWEVMHQLTDHYIHGIVTLKGHKLINKFYQIQEEE